MVPNISKTADAARLEEAAAIILSGGLVAMPTETVYGLAADAANDVATAKIFEAKGRPQFNPLIIHVSGKEMAARYAEFSSVADALADAFWPGALTLVLPRRADSGLSHLVSAGLDTIAIRAPAHPIARRLIDAVDRPLAAPSANRSGAISPTSAADVAQSLGGNIDFIIDGGPCEIGLESTIVKIEEGEVLLLRPGGVPREDIELVIDAPLQKSSDKKIQAPGMMKSHYAPNVSVYLDVLSPPSDHAFLDFAKSNLDHRHRLDLSPDGILLEAAANLFASLRSLDQICTDNDLVGISVAPIPHDGLGEAINDRLRRAAAPRD
ncbi:MAG: threonylcarbamoyl-AMP synthase [Marinicaulis sp.]|nr:threonylcarbamoyl-AMP synthase [Marinicaulis sp.]